MRRTLTALVCAGALLMLASATACSDDDSDASDTTTSTTSTTQSGSPTILAKGQDVELVGGPDTGLGNQTLNIDATEANGAATGTYMVTDNAFTIECANTDTEGVVILGGRATAGPDVEVGQMTALAIREGDPDSVFLVANDIGAKTCTELLDSIPASSLANDSNFVDLEPGSDIQTA